jgi:hypothetical protein
MTLPPLTMPILATSRIGQNIKWCLVMMDSSATATYDPIPSVWEGEDATLLEKMLQFYPKAWPDRILDATANSKRFWKDSTRHVVGLDIDVRYRPEVLGTSTCLPFKTAAFDVVVYDPPHIPNQGKDNQKDFHTRFGLGLKSSANTNYNFSHTYPPFLQEAYRVLMSEGVLFCKITDYIHNHRFQWAHIDLIQAATAAGFYACDCIVKVRKGPIIDPRWKVAHHARKYHCYWLVFRKSNRCE